MKRFRIFMRCRRETERSTRWKAAAKRVEIDAKKADNLRRSLRLRLSAFVFDTEISLSL